MSDTPANPAQSPSAGAVFDQLDMFFDEFQVTVTKAVGVKVHVDELALMNVAQNYVYDLTRYTDFHEIHTPDRARRAAYMAKWLARLRPVQLRLTYEELKALEPDIQAYLTIANELYCLLVVGGILRLDFEEALSNRKLGILLYSLRYRAYSEDAFILYFAELCL